MMKFSSRLLRTICLAALLGAAPTLGSFAQEAAAPAAIAPETVVATVCQSIELSQRQTRFGEHFFDHRQHEVRVAARRFRGTLDDASINDERDRAALGSRIDGEQLHGAARRDDSAAMPTVASFVYRNSSTSSSRSVRGIGGRLSRKIRP
jgi:hypothetical protein